MGNRNLERFRAYFVHAYTASGAVFAFLSAIEICSPQPSARVVFALLFTAVVVDATDGPLARRWDVKRWAAKIDGRTIDDIVDYLTYTFIPLLLVWRMGWVPGPGAVWIAPALILSLMGFANVAAKDEARGYFLGFPSYWNVYAFYAGLAFPYVGPWVNGAILLLLAALTVFPVKFLYPNLAPARWRRPVLLGAGLWAILLACMLPNYPRVNVWIVVLSSIYPLFYTVLSHRMLRS